MFNAIVVVLKRRTSVVGRIDKYTSNFASELMLQSSQRQEIVTKDQ
jgi:hypothetical protein